MVFVDLLGGGRLRWGEGDIDGGGFIVEFYLFS